jgi:hypothetical protein
VVWGMRCMVWCGVYKQVGEHQVSGVWCGVCDAWCGVESIHRLESIRLVVCGAGYAMHGAVCGVYKHVGEHQVSGVYATHGVVVWSL